MIRGVPQRLWRQVRRPRTPATGRTSPSRRDRPQRRRPASVDLDAVQPRSPPMSRATHARSFAVLAKGGFNSPDEPFRRHLCRALPRDRHVAEVSRAEFALAGKVTRLRPARREPRQQFFEAGARHRGLRASPSCCALAPSGRSTTRGERRSHAGRRRRRGPAAGPPADRARHARQRRPGDHACRRRWSPRTRDAGRCELEIAPPLAARCGATASSCTPTSRWPRTAKRCRRSSAPATPSQPLPALRAQAAAAHLPRRGQRDRRRRRAHGARRRRRLGGAADAVRRRADRPRLHAATDEQGRMFVALRRRRARRAPAERHQQRARHLSQGPGRGRQCRRRQPDAADDAAARPEERQQPAAGRGRHRSRGRRAQRAQTHAARRRARSAAPCRCSTTRISRAPSPASPRRRPRCCSCSAGPTVAITLAAPRADAADPGKPGLEQPARRAQGERRSACRVTLLALPAEHLPHRPEGEVRSRLRERRRCSPRSRRRCAPISPSTPARSASRCSSPRSSRRRRRSPASSRSISRALRRHAAGGADRCRRCRYGCSPSRHARRGRRGAAGRAADARSRAARRCWRRCHEHARPPSASTRCCRRSTALRDAEQGEPLRALIAAFAEEFAALEENVEQLYDDQFIETCADWVAPYIGDLIGYRPLHGVAPTVASPRAEVANTIAYRRRKGTALMLEQLAQRRHRLAGARGRVLRAPRHHAIHEPHPPARAGDRRPARPARGCLREGGAFNALAHTRRDAPARERRGPLQHPQHRHLPVAAAAARPDGAAAGRRPRRRQRPQVPLQSARRRPAAVPPRPRPRTTSAISPSRSTCPSRCRCG